MKLGLLARLVRLQFTPVMIMPVVLGASAAWLTDRAFAPLLFLVTLFGAVSLHVAANAIDDVYDFENGVDAISDRLSPRDAPGWKPIPRGIVSVREGMAVAGVFYLLSIFAGVYLSLVVGWLALGIALPGIILSCLYVAPPFRLDYRGLGLGELSILLGFGPIPALGAYYVMTGHLSAIPVLASIPTGLLTAHVLISHDMMFYDAYKESGKISLAVRLGRMTTAKLLTAASASAYVIVIALVGLRYIPTTALLVALALPLTIKLADFRGTQRSPPEYGSRTVLAFLQSVLFTALLALGLVV